MKKYLFHGLSWGWLLFVISLVLFAITISVFRLTAPIVADYRSEIASQVSKIIDRPVEMDSIELTMQRFRPVVKVHGVRILSKIEQETIFNFEALTLAVNPWQSLLKRSLIPSDILLSGSSLSFTRRLDGSITVSGLQLGGNASVPEERLDLLTDLTFQLKDIDVYWQDYPLGTTYNFASRIMQVRVTPESVDLQGEIQLPEGMGENVDVALNIKGPVTNYLDWNGAFHIDASEIDLPLLPLEFTDKLPIVENGTVSLRIWGNWQGQHLQQASGDLGLKNILLRPLESNEGKIPPLFRLDELQTRFNVYEINQGWQIDADKLQITSVNNSWPENSLSLSIQKIADQWLTRGSAAYLDISTLSSLAQVFLNQQTDLANTIESIEPAGGISNLLFSWWQRQPEMLKAYAASGDFSRIRWQGWQNLPGLDGLDGTFEFDQDDGKVLLSGQGMEFSMPELFRDAFWVESLHSELGWTLQKNGTWQLSAKNFQLNNEDIQLTGQAELNLGVQGSKPNLNLSVSFPEFQLEKVRQYLPLEILPEKTGRWLSRAFLAGQAENAVFSYSGALSGKDFKNGASVMKAAFDVADAQLDYKKDWPVISGIAGHVAFENAAMKMEANAAKLNGNDLQKGTAEIADFFRPELKLDFSTAGSLAGAMKYLRDIPVSRSMHSVMDATTTAGDVELGLRLNVPLTKKLNKKISLDGRAQFRNSKLELNANDVVVSDVNGVLDFTESSYTAENISGNFRGSEVAIDVTTAKGVAVDIDIRGQFSVEQLLPGNQLLPAVAQGKSLWHATVQVPSRSERQANRQTNLHMHSRLKGTRINLPAPLGKISVVERDFLMDMPLGKSMPVITFNYDPVLYGKLKLKGKGQEAAIDAAIISLSEQTLNLPGSGIDIIGHWPLLDSSSWIKRFSELAESGGGGSLGGQVRRVSISTSEWFVAGQQFSNVQLTAARNSHYWRANVKSDQISGFLRIPQKNLANSVLVAELEKIYLQKTQRGGEAISPRDLPALKLSVDKFHWQGSLLGQVEINTVKDLWGMQINLSTLSSDALTVEAKGQWREDDQGQQHTSLDFGIQGKNLGKTLNDLEISDTLTGGQGDLQGSIRWNDAPYRLAFPSWNGDVAVNIKEGRLSQVNPGFGRVLGLLNVEQLPKRLALQFSDVSGEGFQFATLGGQVSLVDGEAYLQNFKIHSTAADMELSGSIGLPQHSYNLQLGVTPEFSATVPLAAGLIAGPQAGVVAFVVDKLASSVGMDINKAGEREYRITGTWEAPEVEFINSIVAEDEDLLLELQQE